MTGGRGCDRDRGRGWKGIRLPEGDSGGRRRHKTEPILSRDMDQGKTEFVRCAVEGKLTHTSRVLVMCSQASMREMGVAGLTEFAEWQPELGNGLVREVLKSDEWKRLKLENLAEDCIGLREMMLAMLRGDIRTVDVKKLVRYAWEDTEGKGKPIAATVEEWSRAPGTAQSLMGGNVATHEGTTCQVSPRVGWGCTGEG